MCPKLKTASKTFINYQIQIQTGDSWEDNGDSVINDN